MFRCDISVPPKNLAHITLCQGLSSLYNLTTEQRGFLVQLARTCIDFDRPVNWTLRLYAREQTSTNRVGFLKLDKTFVSSRF